MKTRILTALAVLALTGFVATAAPVHAGTNVNVNLGIPAAVVVAPQPVYVEQPPDMVVIPRSNVYFAPGVSVDLFFYDNRWWNRRGIGGTGPAATTGRGWPWGRGTSLPPSTGCPRTTALSTSMRSRCRTASGRRPTENTAGSTKGTKRNKHGHHDD